MLEAEFARHHPDAVGDPTALPFAFLPSEGEPTRDQPVLPRVPL